jgi:hypothetical protein
LPRGKIAFLFLVRAVVAGVGQAWHVEFDRVATFVAAGRKATKDETAKGQNKAAHLSSPGFAQAEQLLARDCGAGQTRQDRDLFTFDRSWPLSL